MDADHVHCFWLITNLCKLRRDGKQRAVTQTIHTNLISCVCSVTQARKLEQISEITLENLLDRVSTLNRIYMCK